MIPPSWCRLSVTAIQMPQSWCRHPDATIQTQLYWYHAPNATLLMSPSRYRYSHVDILKLPSSWLHPHTATKTSLLHRKWSAKTILNKLTLFQISWKKERHKWSETIKNIWTIGATENKNSNFAFSIYGKGAHLDSNRWQLYWTVKEESSK